MDNTCFRAHRNGTKEKWYKFNDTIVEEFDMNEDTLEAECFGGTYKATVYDTGELVYTQTIHRLICTRIYTMPQKIQPIKTGELRSILDGITPNVSIARCANVALTVSATVSSVLWYKRVKPTLSRGISHLSLVFSLYAHSF